MFQLSAKSSCIAYVVYASMNLSTTKLTPFNDEGNPVKHFQNPQKPNRKKVTGLLRSRVEKIEKISNCGQTMVKLIILEY